MTSTEKCGPWRLHKEDRITYWVHPIKTRRFTGRKYIARYTDGSWEVFAIVRTWYNTETREFLTEEEIVQTFSEVVADGTKAIYDYTANEFVHAEGALD